MMKSKFRDMKQHSPGPNTTGLLKTLLIYIFSRLAQASVQALYNLSSSPVVLGPGAYLPQCWLPFSVFAAALLCNPRLTDHCMMMLSPSPWAGDWLLVTCADGASKRRCPGTRAHMPWPAQVLSSLVMIMCNVYTGPDKSTKSQPPETKAGVWLQWTVMANI